MKLQHLFLLLLLIFISGCATTQETPVAFDNETKAFVQKPVPPPEVPAAPQKAEEQEPEEEYVRQNGVVFAKTEFNGVLKTSYVRLKIVDRNDEKHTYQLHIGEKVEDVALPWEVKTVNPGYFYIELPEGDYYFSNVSIPVGSTTATEEIDIRFKVLPNDIAYLGTLKMVGTKEKIKLGGELPLIKPGFEYTADIVNQLEEAKETLQERFPDVPNAITPQLMSIY